MSDGGEARNEAAPGDEEDDGGGPWNRKGKGRKGGSQGAVPKGKGGKPEEEFPPLAAGGKGKAGNSQAKGGAQAGNTPAAPAQGT